MPDVEVQCKCGAVHGQHKDYVETTPRVFHPVWNLSGGDWYLQVMPRQETTPRCVACKSHVFSLYVPSKR